MDDKPHLINMGGIVFSLSQYLKPTTQHVPDHVPGVMEIKEKPFSSVSIYELDAFVRPEESLLAFLIERSTDTQVSAQILVSEHEDGGFLELAKVSAFAMTGTLQEDYDASLFVYDKDVPIRIDCYNDRTEYGHTAISGIFRGFPSRILLVDGEVMAFAGAQPVGKTGYLLTNIVRGLFNTPIQDHKAGAFVRAVPTTDAVIPFSGFGRFFFKVLPISTHQSPMNSYDVDPISFLVENKGHVPLSPIHLKAVREDDNIHLSWIPRVRGYGGAGYMPADLCSDLDPPYFDGHFVVQVGQGPLMLLNEPRVTVTSHWATTITLWQRHNGKQSIPISVDVLNNNGTYFTRG